jgi:hypothetical protein
MTVTVDTSPINFAVLAPGDPAPSQSVSITNNGTEAVTVSVSIEESAGSSGFSAEFIAQTVVFSNHNPVQQTQTLGASAAITPTAEHSTSGVVSSVVLQVSFTAPRSPVPGSFAATLVVTWDGGSAQIPLLGSTAELTVAVASSQPVALTAGDNATVDFELTYKSLDPTPAQVTLSLATSSDFPEGLTFSSTTVTMPPQYASPGSNPKATPKSGVPNLVPVLVTTRTAKASVTVTSDLIAAKLGDSTGQVFVTGFGTQYVNVAFRVLPQQPKVAVSSPQPIILTPSVPANVTVSIVEPGAFTTLQFEDADNLPDGITVGWPSSAAQGNISIGQGTTSAQFTLTAPITNAQNSQNETLSLKWSAYGGLSSGTVDIEVQILASQIIWTTPNAQVEELGAGATGSATWTLTSNGNWIYTGSVKGEGDGVSVDFYFEMWTEPPLTINGKPSGVVVVYTGNTGSSPVVTWEQAGNDPIITANWPFFLISSYKGKLGISITAGWWEVPLAIAMYLLGAGSEHQYNKEGVSIPESSSS